MNTAISTSNDRRRIVAAARRVAGIIDASGWTQKKLAERLGITQATVSRIIRGDQGISDELGKKILTLATEWGVERKRKA
jgi:transcriptional regulator with XRE-family HTH domain